MKNCFGILIFSSLAFAQAGHWEGNLQLPNREMPITLDVVKNAKGEWAAAFGFPAQNATDISVSDLSVEGKTVKFKLDPLPNKPGFEATIGEDGSMRGLMKAPGGEVAVELKRTGEGKIAAMVPSPAVAKEFEGTWEGSLVVPSGALRILLHLQNQPDKTVMGTVESPDQSTSSMPVATVVQKDASLEFKVRMVSGGFKGAINKEGTEIAGTWSQGNNNLPLTFKKTAAK
jgi:hypothetical protein